MWKLKSKLIIAYEHRICLYSISADFVNVIIENSIIEINFEIGRNI